MDLYVYNLDEYTGDTRQGNEYAPVWNFRLAVAGSSDSGKTTMLLNLLMGDAKAKEDGNRYILCDEIVLICRYLDEPKWQMVKDFFDDSEDVTFRAISYHQIPDVEDFDPKIATVVIFEDLMDAPKNIQEKITGYFTHGRHRNISAIYVAQRFFAIPKAIRENVNYISLHGGHGSLSDTKRIIRQYTNESDSLAPIIDELTLSKEFIVFDLRRPKTDPLAIRVRWDTSLRTFIESSKNDSRIITDSSKIDLRCRFTSYGQKAIAEAKKNNLLKEFARNFPSPKERKLYLIPDALSKAKNSDIWAKYVFREAYGINDRTLGDEYKKFLSQVKNVCVTRNNSPVSVTPFDRYRELLNERPLSDKKIIEGIEALLKLFNDGLMKKPILQVGINSLFHSF